MKIYNTLSKQVEEFSPITPKTVGMYHCGPTVYDTPHIGNNRTSVVNDLIRRVFEYNGYTVNQVTNITDVDDKTIKKSKENNISLKELTLKYEAEFIAGLKSLNTLPPTHLLRATENIDEMIKLVEKLLEKGVAYKADDGVYLSISKVKDYGKLAGIDLKAKPETVSQERIANDEYDKENPHDFALWKFSDESDKDVSWPAPFGTGRPGWHIECSAMSMKVLGPTIDIHTGGTDLMFPHHTNEIAQSESATGKQYVRYWMHAGFMNIKDEKMSKSLGNFIKLSDLEKEAISPLSFRYWILTAHYRSQVNFTYEAIKGSQNAFVRLLKIVGSYPEGGSINKDYQNNFLSFINDDLNLPKAVALAWDLIKDKSVSDADKRATLLDFDRVFGLNLGSMPYTEPESIPVEITALSEAREEARKNREWEKADALRQEIEERGYSLRDTESGVEITERF